ncbi:uncharacterized protein [Eucyclogobius newberryi]|uniref:uncharacterized protein n=1 Tax=Eucyclogobius newberryi TaxID=166745 RepID=UPI003B5953E6
MADSRAPESLSEAPSSKQSSDSEGLHQNCCSTSKEQPEALSRDHNSRCPTDDGPGRRIDQHLLVTGSTSPFLLEEHTLKDMCTLVQSSCTLVDSSARAPLLVCKRPMQLQQCNMVTTICRGALGSDSTSPQLFQGSLGPQCSLGPQWSLGPQCSLGPQTIATEEFSCDSSQCYGSHFHHTNLEDTFAAYCHPQPIPAPSQLLPPLTGPEALPHLGLPRLMSSLSETGLDAKPVSCCCQLGCSWVSMLPQPQRVCTVRARDVGTLTTSKSLRDIGVQTEDSSSHVFPQICLSEETHRECQKTSQDAPQKASSKSPVKEVKWDAEGMTWEVYGASVDPEELGLAIQKHLELQIKETAGRAAKLSRQNTNTSRHSVSCQRKRRMLGSLRPPACCTRTTTAVD